MADEINELDDLTQTVKVQQVHRGGWGIVIQWSSVIGQTHRNSGVETVRQPNDEVRVSTPADAHDFNLLAVKRMMGMGDRHQFRRLLG